MRKIAAQASRESKIIETVRKELVVLRAIEKAAIRFPPMPSTEVKEIYNGTKIVPELPGVYFGWNGDRVDYVGMSINLRGRIRSTHEHLQHCKKVSWLIFKVSKFALMRIEAFYIAIFGPKYNWKTFQD